MLNSQQLRNVNNFLQNGSFNVDGKSAMILAGSIVAIDKEIEVLEADQKQEQGKA